jgi:hypothetical protein
LGSDCRSQRIFGGGEGSLGAIANRLVEDPVVGTDEALQDGQLPRHRFPHGGPISLPERGTPFDIRKEEGDGAAGEISHDPLQTLGWMWCCSIVACGHGDQSRDLPTHHCDDLYGVNW